MRKIAKRRLQATLADVAPRACDIGPDVDAERFHPVNLSRLSGNARLPASDFKAQEMLGNACFSIDEEPRWQIAS